MNSNIAILRKCILLSIFFIFADNNAIAATISSKDIFIEAQTNNTSPMLQSQTIYTVRLYFRIPLQDSALLDPHTDNVLTYRIGNGSVYDTVHHGIAYRVLAQRYALYPQVSGSIVINSARLIGHNLWDGTPVKIDGPLLTLHVQPIPSTISKTKWLPANKLSLQETWSPSPPTFHPGEPITRVITLQATAVPEIRLPYLPNSSFVLPTKNIKMYFDPPQSWMDISQNEVISKRVWKITYLPLNNDKTSTISIITIPKIDIPWWNNQTKQVEIVSLPSKNISNVPLPLKNSANATLSPRNTSNLNLSSRNTSFETDVTNSQNLNNGHYVINAQIHSQSTVSFLFNAKTSRANTNINNTTSFSQNPAETTNTKTTSDNRKIGIALSILLKRLAGKLLFVLLIIIAIGYGTCYINRRRILVKTQTVSLNTAKYLHNSYISPNSTHKHFYNICKYINNAHKKFNNIYNYKKKSNRSLLPELYPDP